MKEKPEHGKLEPSMNDIPENAITGRNGENRHWNHMFLDAIKAAVVVHDPDTKIIACNKMAEELLGLSKDQMLGKAAIDPAWDFLDETGSSMPLERYPVNQVLSSREPLKDLVAGIRRPDKSDPVWVLVNAEPSIDQNGRLFQVVITFMDITERKKEEEELKRYRHHLEELVNERTAELADAKEIAVTSTKELEAFTYSVSHDLRAPLRHIDGFLKLLQEKAAAELDKQSRHYMDNIADAAQKMGRLIDELLSFIRMGRHSMSYQRVALEALMQDVIRELEPDAAGRNVDWHIGDLPAVGCDAAMLRMVLTNLVSNALKFTRPRQQPRIEIGSLPDQASETVIYVRDNGVGFDMTYADKLFGVFQRLHCAEEFEGTGIGLANVRRIIDRHGGRIWAEGSPDQGATFYFALPQR